MSGEVDRFDLGAAYLRNAHGDLRAFMAGLAAKLEGALPGSVTVERQRYGLLLRNSYVSAIAVSAGPDLLRLALAKSGIEASVSKTVRGVTISSKAIKVPEWFERLSTHVGAAGEGAESARETIYRFLVA